MAILDKVLGKKDEPATDGLKPNAQAALVFAAVGGPKNIKSVDYCATRLRFKLNDPSKVNDDACKEAGSLGVVKPEDGPEDEVHVVMGTNANLVAYELQQLL